jgi:hypothetical protein
LTHKNYDYLNWISYQESNKGVNKGKNSFEEDYHNTVLLQISFRHLSAYTFLQDAKNENIISSFK